MPETQVISPAESLVAAPAASRLPATPEETREVATGISRALRRAARQARAPAGIVSGGAGFNARKGHRAFRLALLASFVAMVAVPFIVTSLYWGLVAAPQYATQLKFALRAGEASPLDALGGMFGVNTAQSQDTQLVADFIRSRGMVEALQASLNLRRIYASDHADYFSRFSPREPIEDLEKYWRKRVDVKVETLSGIVSIDVRAFTPGDALALGEKILELSERLVNDISTRARKDAVKLAQTELARAEQRLQTATVAMREARNVEGVLDAGSAAESINKIVTALRLEKSRLEQDLVVQGAAAADAPQSRILQSRIASIKAQIDDYTSRIAGTGQASGSSSMADRLSVLSRRQIDLDLARLQYTQAAAVFENARVELETQHAYLALAQAPTLAQKSTYPKRWWEWSIIVIPCTIVWAALAATALLVRDHMAK